MSSSEVVNLSRLSVSQPSVKELTTGTCDESYVNGRSQVIVDSAGLLVRCAAGGDEHTRMSMEGHVLNGSAIASHTRGKSVYSDP